MSQHTPGPWGIDDQRVSPCGNWCAEIVPVASAYRGVVCSVQSAEHIGGIDHDEAQANANLIAAAPGMRKALEQVEVMLQEIVAYTVPTSEAGRQARSALEMIRVTIARARGES